MTSTQDTKDNKQGDFPKRNNKNNLHKYEDVLQMNKPQLDAIISKMKRTDGFMSFKPSIGGGNSSNSLFPSSSGETIISIHNNNSRIDTISDITHQTTSTTSDRHNAKIKRLKRSQQKEKMVLTRENTQGEGSLGQKSRNKNHGV